jgi:hypothetical protein
MRLMLSCIGVLVVGVKSVARERGRGFGPEVRCLSWPPPRLSYSVCLCPPFFLPPGKPWTSPFIDTRRCPAVQWRRSYGLTWLAKKCLEPCTRANVSVGEALEPRRNVADDAARGPADVSLLP